MTDLSSFTKDFNPRTDKYDLGYIDEFYNDLLTPLKNRTINVLEIGIYFGHSVMLWQAFFPQATIYCADIVECPGIDNLDRVIQYTESAYTPEFMGKLTGLSFDIIIDDGPHTLETMKYFLIHYPRLLKNNGVLILEDIISTSWTPELLQTVPPGYSATVHHLAGKQKTQELRDLWCDGLDVITVQRVDSP